MEILADDNLFAFFHDRVGAARKALGAEVDEHTEFYLVHLLVEFLQTGRLTSLDGQRTDERPLAIRLLEGRQAPAGQAYRQLKHIADSTLYVLGFFAESLRRSTVDLRYYAGVGQGAYRSLASLAESRSSGGGELYDALARRFVDCAEVLTEVRTELRQDTDVLSLYEDWLVFGDARAARRLRSLGVLSTTPDKVH